MARSERLSNDRTAAVGKRIWVLIPLLVALAVLAAAWRFGPLAQWLTADSLERAANWVRQTPWGPLWVIGAYILAALCALPITVMIALTAMLFEPLTAFAYALAGALAGGSLGFALGHVLGHSTVHRLAGSRLHELSSRLGRRGFYSVLVIRLLPLAPFTIANIVVGASHVRWRDFLLGTALGTAPGALALTVFMDRLLAAARDPSPMAIAVFAGVALLIVAGLIGIRYWLRNSG